MSVYTKEDMPDRYHFTKNTRIPPITLVADVGYTIHYVKVSS